MEKLGFTTTVLHSDRQTMIEHGSLHAPLHPSIAYEYHDANEIAAVFQGKRSGYSYGRQNNPTITALEKKITAMEQGVDTSCFATGMGAITSTILALLKSGDHLISTTYLFGNTNSFFTTTLPKLGIEVSFVDATDVNNVKAAIQNNTKIVFVESIANPCTQVADLANIGDYCCANNLVYIVDNTMPSPFIFQAKSVKASLIINSLSKHIGGHGNALGGSVTETGYFDWSRYTNIYPMYKKGDRKQWGLLQIRKKGLRDMGATLSPDAAHRIAIGSETLGLRITQASHNAQILANYLSNHPKIDRVFYPGLKTHPEHSRATELFKYYGVLMSINLHASINCLDFLNQLTLVIVASNLGDNRTLTLPIAQTIFYEMGEDRRAEMGITQGTIRLSVGIEDSADLLADFDQALAYFS